jgi:hypothetical protein
MDQRNDPSHTSVLIQQPVVKYKMGVILRLPYFPDLGFCDIFLFPKIKLKLNGRRFDTTEIQAESQRMLDTLTEKDFQEAFQKLEETEVPVSTCGRELHRG